MGNNQYWIVFPCELSRRRFPLWRHAVRPPPRLPT